MASNSKRSTHDEAKFSEAEKDWNLEKLYEDLRVAKQRCGSVKRKVLTEIEKCHLRGLLCGCSDKEIANERGVVVGTVSDTLSKTLYRYIEELLDYEEEIRHWSDVRDLLEKAGYKIQVSEQSQLSYPLPDEKENTLEASHKIGATSFLEYFSKSIDQLKSKDFDVRIGAISTLGTLAKYSPPAEHWTIMEYLAAFIRTNAPRKEEEEGEEERSLKLLEDIQAALTVIGGRDPNKVRGVLDLSNTNIREANLREAELQEINLSAAQLQGADLCGAKLQGAYLIKANLKEAQLVMANLEGAYIYQANLEEAKLLEAILRRTKLTEANLKEADLYNADLEFTDLRKANLERAKFDFAKLTAAQLSQANLRDTYLIGANLKGTNFSETDVELKQIEYAFGDSTTVLPKNVARPAHWI